MHTNTNHTHNSGTHTDTQLTYTQHTRNTPGAYTPQADVHTHITHTAWALTLTQNSHRHNTHRTPQVHTPHRQTCTHRTRVLFSARGHAGAQQLKGLKAQPLRKADFPITPPRLRWGQRETQQGETAGGPRESCEKTDSSHPQRRAGWRDPSGKAKMGRPLGQGSTREAHASCSRVDVPLNFWSHF